MDKIDVNLDEIQDNLLTHFRTLAEDRENSGFPVFALEHGLNREKIKLIRGLLRSRIQKRKRLAPHWLLWAIHASEAGYDYEGDEYWPSFEKQTPNWQYSDRPKVTGWFQKFQKTFNGVEPSGPWAENFSIIAWPITHALLPRYLQRQFARLLFDVRYHLISASLDAVSIGRLLAAHSSHTSTRVRVFLEQEELTGQIVAGLLQGDSVNTNALIHPPTLNRIVADLERVRSSREWLNETRRVVRDRFKGIGRGTYPLPSHGSPVDSHGSDLPDNLRFVIRPDLFLRHNRNGTWSALLQLKSLRPIAAKSSGLRVFLDGTRCRLNGAPDWKPTGWLLSGNRTGAIKRWPDSDTPLICFERANPLMNHLLEAEYRLTKGPIWLFRIGNDGIARRSASLTVRPGKDYVVATTESPPNNLSEGASCIVECEGVHAFRLAVPSQVPADFTARLSEIGIDVSRAIQISPAGLPGRGWDGDGSMEWLTTESPCFRIDPDHPLDTLSFRLDDGPEQVVATAPLGNPTFVRLPPLASGSHLLTVRARRSSTLDGAVTTPAAKGFAKLAVRDPEPWTPGVASHPGLIVIQDPLDASLDIFWRNELNLSVNGPKGFTVRVSLKLYTADGRPSLCDAVSDSMALPIMPDTWRSTFAKYLKSEHRAWKYLEATSCTLEIIGETLGTCVLNFEHDPSPIRWSLTSRKNQTFVRLIDDSGLHENAPDIEFFSMDRPLVGVPLNAETAREEVQVTPPGGLYLARHPPFMDAAVVSPSSAQKLRDLGVKPDVHVSAGAPAVRQAFDILRHWHNARHAGLLADIRRGKVRECIFNAIFISICGRNWARAEKDFVKRPCSAGTLEILRNLVDKRTLFGHRVARLGAQVESEEAVAARFTAEAGRLHISQDRNLCYFALRFASRRDDVLDRQLPDDGVSKLIDTPALLRGARLVSLLREHQLDA